MVLIRTLPDSAHPFHFPAVSSLGHSAWCPDLHRKLVKTSLHIALLLEFLILSFTSETQELGTLSRFPRLLWQGLWDLGSFSPALGRMSFHPNTTWGHFNQSLLSRGSSYLAWAEKYGSLKVWILSLILSHNSDLHGCLRCLGIQIFPVVSCGSILTGYTCLAIINMSSEASHT